MIRQIEYQYEVGGIFTLFNNFWVGGVFRDADAIVGMAGLNLGPSLRLAYAYDFKIGNTFRNIRTLGSHEIVLRYRMGLTVSEDAEQTPRFFD
jgi:hypothetical protein